ncbi:MAG: phosphatidate cytidylyltransferase [Aquifex sp.]|nr:MAG: phosphatidate cytidylyltransferase [Aquifex sp.]
MLELRRKIFHIISILMLSIPILFFPYWLNILLFLLGIITNFLIVARYEPIMKLFGFLIELFERERNLSTPAIQSLYALVGVFLSYILFGKEAVYGIVVLAVGDGFSGLIGYYLGKNKLPYNPNKSVEGTLVFFFSSFLALLIFTQPMKAFTISFICAILESLDLRLDDNFLIPVIASFLGKVL